MVVETYYTNTVVLSNGHGGENVRIQMYNNSDGFVNDVRMINWKGEVVWEESAAIGVNGTRTFWCGKNVAKIQVKVRRTSAPSYYIARCVCNVFFQ